MSTGILSLPVRKSDHINGAIARNASVVILAGKLCARFGIKEIIMLWEKVIEIKSKIYILFFHEIVTNFKDDHWPNFADCLSRPLEHLIIMPVSINLDEIQSGNFSLLTKIIQTDCLYPLSRFSCSQVNRMQCCFINIPPTFQLEYALICGCFCVWSDRKA